MSSASVVFSIQYSDIMNEHKFIDVLNSHVSVIQRIFFGALGFKYVKIERISFIDYKSKTFHPNFPFNKRLNIHNTSTLDKFGFGKYSGAFFDVIVRLEDNNPRNYRIFYEIDGVSHIITQPQPQPTQLSPQPQLQPSIQLPTIPTTTQQPSPTQPHQIHILGYDRICIKKGRATYIEYDGKHISLTEAKKLEKDLQKQNKDGSVHFKPPI